MQELVELCKTKYTEAEVAQIAHAVEYATKSHEGQLRESGEPYIVHPISVAKTLFLIGMDASCVIAGLLHDVVEDCGVGCDVIAKEFGEEVAIMVDGVTKLSKTGMMPSKEERQAENLRKMFLAIARDMRVVIIKLADRLNNMRTLGACSEEKQKRIARETLDVYAPLAHRFGMGAIKCELEDLSLKYLDPEAYESLKAAIEPQQRERMAFLESAMEQITEKLSKAGIEAKVNGRPKHLYSIYRKIIKQNVLLDEIYDLTALRVIVNSIADCYAALGIVHTMWRPIPGRFKDYISTPKPNLYQSIHTTLFGDNGQPFEVQIRTNEMHRIAEYGVAAHWMYKEGRDDRNALDQKLSWFREALEYQDYSTSAKEFIESIQIDFFSEYVFVLTPRGEIIDLPLGSTPLDFAYRIHTDIGNRVLHAKVNGSIVRLDYKLRTNDVVEIITSSTENPSRDWLNIVKTQQAKAKIRQWFKKADKDDDIVRGRETFIVALGKQNRQMSDFTQEEFDALLEGYSMSKLDDLFAAIGRGGLPVIQVANKLTESIRREESEAKLETDIAEKLEKSSEASAPYSADKGVSVKGFPTMAVHFAHCCTPLPGDEIFGYITRGRGVSVHRADCCNFAALHEEPDRIIEVEWLTGRYGEYVVYINIVANERKGLLADVSRALLSMNIDIRYINADTNSEGKIATVRLAFAIEDSYRLKNIMASLLLIESVKEVYRING